MTNLAIFESFPNIETDRLSLKKIDENDYKEIFNIFSSDELMQYYDIEPIKTFEEAKELIRSLERRFNNKKGIRWGIVLKENNQLIGTCGFHALDKDVRKCELGYDLLKEYQGKGYMSEAVLSVLEFGFKSFQMNRIHALVEPENIKSSQLLKRVGFTEEGLLREYEFYKEKYINLIMFSFLKSDWFNK